MAFDVTAVLKANTGDFVSGMKAAKASLSGAKESMESLKESTSSAGSVFKSVLGANIVSSAVISGLTTLKNTVAGTFSSAISEGAKLEQSFGGIETLYQGATAEAKAYAAQAARAGISANNYAEQAVSFGASLKQALGGDAVAAAKAADMAIMDMADNAAKMGTDISTIQGTYQSLARGNYAMLDNLKLGFGGTKAEMERLLRTAEKMPQAMGKKFDISNFADVVEAIHIVQDDLGIMGVAAEEAKGTFSGSLGYMQASWQNLLGAITSGELDIGPQLQMLVDSTSAFLFGNFIPMVARIFAKLPETIGTLFASAGPALEAGLKKSFPKLGSLFATFGDTGVFLTMQEALESIGNLFKTVFSAGSNDMNAAKDVAEALGDVFNLVFFTIQDLADGATRLFQAFANTGAFTALKDAFYQLSKAGLDLSEKLSGSFPWEMIGTAAGKVVTFVANIIKSIAELSQKVDGDILRGGVKGVLALVAAFKGLNFLKSFNPFSRFKIPNPFTGLASMAKAAGAAVKNAFSGLGKGISSAFKGIGTGISTVFQGIARAISMLNPAGIASFALGVAAVTTALVALSAVQGMVLPFLQGLSDVFVNLVGGVLQTFVSAIIALAPAMSPIASALALLSPLVVAVGQALAAAAPFVVAFGIAIGQIAESLGAAASSIISALTPLVGILSSTFVQTVSIVSGAIVQIIQALAPFIPSVTEMVVALAPVLSQIAQAFTTLIEQISPILESLSNLLDGFGDNIKKVLDGAKGVVESFGSSIRTVLDGVAGIFDSLGNAALNAGKGVKMMAQGIEMLTDLPLGDLTATLASVAGGLTSIANSGIATAGPGLQAAGLGMQMIAMSAQVASAAIQLMPMALTMLISSIGPLPAQLTLAGTAMTAFAMSAKSSVMSLMAIGASITQFATMLMTIGPSASVAQSGMAGFARQANTAGVSMRRLGAFANQVLAQITALGAVITQHMTGSASVTVQASATMSGAVRMAGTQMTVSMQGSMRQIKSVVLNGMAGSVQAVRNSGSQMVAAWRSAGQQMVVATQSFANSTNGYLRSVGSGVNLYSNGYSLMSGLKSGIDAGWSVIKSDVSKMAQWIKDHKGPISYDKRLLIDNGLAIMSGLNRGIQSGWRQVQSSVLGMAGSISKLMQTALDNSFDVSVAPTLSNSVAVSHSQSVQHNIDNTSHQRVLVDKLDELLDAIKEGKVIYMDDKEVGSIIDRRLGQNTDLGGRFAW